MIGQNFSLNDSLTQRLADNVRSSRLQISSDAIELYFQNLSETLEEFLKETSSIMMKQM